MASKLDKSDPAVAYAQAMYSRAVACWTCDLLRLRAKGLDRPSAKRIPRPLPQGVHEFSGEAFLLMGRDGTPLLRRAA